MSTHATGRPVAVVTGASRGLGLALAGELARRHHDLVIRARDADGVRAAREALSRGPVDDAPLPRRPVAARSDRRRRATRALHRPLPRSLRALTRLDRRAARHLHQHGAPGSGR